MAVREDAERRTDGPARLPELGPLGLARYAWRQLTSMRTALLLLVLLSVAAVPGSIIPQRSVDPTAVAQYVQENPRTAPWFDRLDLFDIYSSPWFSAIYLLLFVSLVGCVLPRTSVHLRAVRARPPRTPSRLSRMPEHRRVEVELPAGTTAPQVLAAARDVLRSRRRYRVEVRDGSAAGPAGSSGASGASGRGSVGAEAGHLRETGNLVFHLSLVGLLIAVALGSMFGYRGEILLTQGATFSNTTLGYDSIQPGSRFDPDALPPFRLTLEDLQVEFEESVAGNQFAAPRDFEAAVTVVDEPGDAPRAERIRVNEPLSIDDAHVYLSGNGYAPVVTVRDGEGEVAYSGPQPFLPQDAFYSSSGVIKAPDASPEQIGLQGAFLPTSEIDPDLGPISLFPDARDPRLFLTAWVGDLGLDDGSPQSVFTLDTTGMQQLLTDRGTPFSFALRPGEAIDLPDGAGSVSFDGLVRFAAIDVRHDPAKNAALVFSVLAMLGLVASLFIKRRRLWVQVVPGDGGHGRTVIEVAALARGDDPGLGAEVDRVQRQLLARLGVEDLAAPHGEDEDGSVQQDVQDDEQDVQEDPR